MAIKDDLIAAVQTAADGSSKDGTKIGLGTPGSVIPVDNRDDAKTGQAWSDGSSWDAVMEGIAVVIGTEASRPTLNGYDEATGQSTTNVALEDITGLTFDLVTAVQGRIVALMTIDCSTTGGAPATGAWAISINSVDGTEMTRSLSGFNDMGALSVQARSASLAPGTYTVKGRHRRVSGASTINTDIAQLSALFVAD